MWTDTLAELPWRGDPADIIAASERDPYAVLRRLADLVPDWHRDAACAGTDVVAFFPGLGERSTLAYELCGRCPVRAECLDWAIDERINHGVFGGLSPAARRAHARSERAQGVHGSIPGAVPADGHPAPSTPPR